MAVNWLPSGDLGAEYAHGLQIGSQVAEAQQRLQQEQAHAAATAQAHTAQLAQDAKIEQARLQTATAYHQQTLELQKQRLEQVQQQNAQKLRATAMKAADQQGFAQDMAGGASVEQALFRHPSLATPGAAIAAHKDTLDAAGQHLELQRQQLDLSKGRLDLARQAMEDRENKGASVPEMKAARDATTDEGAKSLLQDKLDQRASDMATRGSVPMTPDNAPGFVKSAIAAVRPPKGGTTSAPKKGEVYKGHKFLGGDPADKNNWEKVD